MIVSVDPHSGVPVYRQLMEQIRFHVASGLLHAGDEVPSTRALSAVLGVNPMTISKAFQLLEQEGVLERRPGLPSVVSAGAGSDLNRARLDQLRAGLRPAVQMVRQLGVDTDDAVAVLRELLDDDDDGER